MNKNYAEPERARAELDKKEQQLNLRQERISAKVLQREEAVTRREADLESRELIIRSVRVGLSRKKEELEQQARMQTEKTLTNMQVFEQRNYKAWLRVGYVVTKLIKATHSTHLDIIKPSSCSIRINTAYSTVFLSRLRGLVTWKNWSDASDAITGLLFGDHAPLRVPVQARPEVVKLLSEHGQRSRDRKTT